MRLFSHRCFVWGLWAIVALRAWSAQAAVLTFTPVADTYVSNKSTAANYGTITTFTINNNGNGKRVALVRFDLSSVVGTITNLRLDLTGTATTIGKTLKVYGVVAGESWVETGANWTNAPGVNHAWTTTASGGLADYLFSGDLYGSGAVLASFAPTAHSGVLAAFNAAGGPVLNFVSADADKVVTFLIAEDDLPDDPGNVWATREAATGRPLLTVTFTPPPPSPPPPALPTHPAVVTFQPGADTYVSNKSVGTNFGTATTFTANNSVNGHRVMLLRFDLRSISGPITSLRLDLTGTAMTVGKALNVYGLVNGEGWTESGVTWMNGPGVNHAWTVQTGGLADYLFPGDLYGAGAVLASFTPTANSGVLAAFYASSGPVLNFVNADADKIVSFLIAETDPGDAPGNIFATREAPGKSPLLTVTCVPAGTLPAVIRVILLGGQSNALGYAAPALLPAALLVPQTDVLFYEQVDGQAANADGTLGALHTLHPGASTIPGDFGPELTLGQQLSPLLKQMPGTQLAIIKYAKGGSSLSFDWKAGGTGAMTGDGTVYQTFQQVVANGLTKLAATFPTSAIRLEGFVWVQGEQDTNNLTNATAYGSRLATFIADVRATYGATLPFFFSRLSAQQTFYSDPASTRYSAYLQLRQGQQNTAANVAGAYLVDIDGPAFTVSSTDFIHFDTAGQQALGSALAARAGDVLVLRVTGLTVTAAGVQITWNAIPGRSYGIQTSGDLVTWSMPLSVGVTGTWTDTAPSAGGARYYRVLEN